ncbi:hypothetical protein BO94DRAFT_476006, partial [Aspergillus sclerotioniger CBS 115572]
PHPLPKSVKVRSTCNACQQAKIRCSHEKPSCRRCQKHNLSCVYSMSRRLGRPAKKKDGGEDMDTLELDHHHHNHNNNNRGRSGCKKQKKRVVDQEESILDGDGDVLDEHPLMMMDEGVGSFSLFLSLSLSLSLFLPSGMWMSVDDIVSDAGIDLSTDSWLHEFMSNPAADLAQEKELLDSLGLSSIKPESTCAERSPDLKDIPKTLIPDASDSHYIAPTSFEQDPLIEVDPHPESKYIKEESLSWPQPFSTMDDFPTRSMVTEASAFTQTKVSKRPYAYGFPSTTGDIKPPPVMLAPQHYQCQCHERTTQDLIRVNIFASRASPCATIDSIICCQRVLQQLSEMILQCGVCSRTRLNLLMVVIVSIDGLVNALEPITAMETGLVDRLFTGYHDQLLPEIPGNANVLRYRGNGSKRQVEACALKIGTFCVSYEDKFIFIKQLLLFRLGGLLDTVRRIQACTQDTLAMPASQGRLMMIMETEQRLRAVIIRTQRITILDLTQRIHTHTQEILTCTECRTPSSLTMLPALADHCLGLFEAVCVAYNMTGTSSKGLFDAGQSLPLPRVICMRSKTQLGQMELDEKEEGLLVRMLVGRGWGGWWRGWGWWLRGGGLLGEGWCWWWGGEGV